MLYVEGFLKYGNDKPEILNLLSLLYHRILSNFISNSKYQRKFLF